MTSTTLKEIAKTLGLSISTVSRALKNHPDISVKTKTIVSELARTLDYEPNANAISLRTKANRIFGIIVPTISNFFYDSFIAAVEEESRKNNYNILILQSSDDENIEEENLKLCRQNRVSGVFVCISNKTKNIEPFIKLKEQKLPLIFFDKVPSNPDFNKVCVADAEAATLAAEALIQSKKTNIVALFGSRNLSITEKRMAAFEETFKKSKEKFLYKVEYCHNTHEAYEQSLRYLNLKKKPNAFFCMSDEILCGTMKAIQQMKLSIPDDVAVIAISDGFFPKLYTPEITYVETSGAKLGKAAFARMMECLVEVNDYKEVLINATLVKGQSI